MILLYHERKLELRRYCNQLFAEEGEGGRTAVKCADISDGSVVSRHYGSITERSSLIVSATTYNMQNRCWHVFPLFFLLNKYKQL